MGDPVEVKHGFVSLIQNPWFVIVNLKLEIVCYQSHTIEVGGTGELVVVWWKGVENKSAHFLGYFKMG